MNREKLIIIVSDYAKKTRRPYSAVWSVLYDELQAKTKKNFIVAAQNQGKRTLDYIFLEGYGDLALSVAREVFQ